jgi:radical SAM protein with 4Fe4S-binding SPASM domain
VPLGLPFGVPFRVRIGRRALIRRRFRFDRERAFLRTASKYLLYRPEDDVLIVPPNRVYKLNASAAAIYRYAVAGGDLALLPGLDERRALDVRAFFSDLADACAGKPVSLERVPYDFSFTSLPVLGEIAITYRCNNRCLFCYAGCGPCTTAGGASSEELDTARVERVIDAFIRDAKLPFFSFTGGEPTLRDDLERLCSYATKKGLRINLITNGTLIDASRAKALKRAGLETAQVSLEAPDEATHDLLCGRAGAYRETVAGIRALSGAGIRVQTNTTLTTVNLPLAASMPEALASLGVRRFSMNMFIPTVRSPRADELFVPYEAIGGVVDSVSRAAKGVGSEFLWYSPTPYCVYNPIARGHGNKGCAALDGLLHVNPRGEVLPCSSWDESVGNILKDGFTSLWFSERARHYKRKEFASSGCKSCDAFLACQGACPLYFAYTGEGGLPKKAAVGGAS